MKALSHCQICGRSIKANTGVIAHHGYQRPGDGWQTASCMGARFRPYEVACDALPPAIASCARYIGQQEAALADWIANPPAEIKYQRTDTRTARPIGPERTFIRPDGFDGAAAKDNYMSDTYQWRYVTTRNAFGRRIKSSQESLAYLEKRLADWRAPDSEADAIQGLSEAIRETERKYPLPRCHHGSALVDGAGERLEPSCGCRFTHFHRAS